MIHPTAWPTSYPLRLPTEAAWYWSPSPCAAAAATAMSCNPEGSVKKFNGKTCECSCHLATLTKFVAIPHGGASLARGRAAAHPSAVTNPAPFTISLGPMM